MPPPPPLYIPCGSLDDEDVRSLVRLALSTDVSRVDTHGARRTALKYLLQMRSVDFDLSAHVNADQWPSLEKNFAQLSKVDLFKKDFALDNDDRLEEFWELTSDSPRIHPLAKKARQFTNGEQIFAETQIKVYFNARQLKNIPHSQATFSTSGFVDEDCRASLRQNPLETRHNRGDIHTKRGRIEQVIFDIPTDKQIIVLDFADERMPGGSRRLPPPPPSPLFFSARSVSLRRHDSRRDDLLPFQSLSRAARSEIRTFPRWISHS